MNKISNLLIVVIFVIKKYVETDLKVRDHCYITRKYRGSAHQDCNLKLKIGHETIKIPVIFHNLTSLFQKKLSYPQVLYYCQIW